MLGHTRQELDSCIWEQGAYTKKYRSRRRGAQVQALRRPGLYSRRVRAFLASGQTYDNPHYRQSGGPAGYDIRSMVGSEVDTGKSDAAGY